MSDSPPPPSQLETVMDSPGPPGTKVELHVLPIKANEQRNDKSRIRDTSPRKFQVFARLSRAPLGAESVKIGFGADDGDSYFVVPDAAVVIRARSSEGMFDIRKNQKGELSLIEFECIAKGSADARNKFHAAVLTCPLS